MSVQLKSHLFDLNGSSALPWIEGVIQEEYESFDDPTSKLMNVMDMKNGIAQFTQVSSLSAVGKVGEAAEIPQDRIRQGYSSTFTAEKYAMLLATSHETMQDEKYDVLSKNPRRLARAFFSAQQISAASIYNNAFSSSYVGGDAKALCATDHPLLALGAGTSSNRLASDADLSITSLKDMITLFKKQKDSAGNKIMIKPKKLVVPTELAYDAYELCKSTMLPGGSTNNVNSVGPDGIFTIEPVVFEYLTDTDAWFLQGDPVDTEIYWMWAERFQTATQEEFKSMVALTRAHARWQVGFADWRGVCGTTGA